MNKLTREERLPEPGLSCCLRCAEELHLAVVQRVNPYSASGCAALWPSGQQCGLPTGHRRPPHLTHEEHVDKHKHLHKALDILAADFLLHNEDKTLDASIYELLRWSAEQSENPTPNRAEVSE